MKKLSLLILMMLSISSCHLYSSSPKPREGQCYEDSHNANSIKIRKCGDYGCAYQYWNTDDQRYEGVLYYDRFSFFNKRADCLCDL